MFAYTAVAANGARVSEKMAAASVDEVVEALLRAGYSPLTVVPASSASAGAAVSSVVARMNAKPAKMRGTELAAFTSQLYQLLKAGIAMPQAVATLAEGQKNDRVGEALRTISERMVAGVSVADAFDGYPKCFDDVFRAYMAAGEQTGNMAETVQRLSHIVEKRAEIRRKVTEVSFYPVLVSGVIVFMLAAIIMFVVPRYTTIYSSFGAELPGPTKAVVALSKVFPIALAAIAAAIAGFVSFNRSRRDDLQFGTRLDRLRFRMPLFGKLNHNLVLYRWASTVGGASQAGVPLSTALDLGGRAAGSRWVRAATVDLTAALTQGRPLSSELGNYEDLFPPTLRKMVATGEATGELPSMLNNVADATENEVDLIVATMGAKLEVALLAFMAVSVGSILVALYLPILRLTDTISNSVGG
jgi:type IV pilus assembly protein PilC